MNNITRILTLLMYHSRWLLVIFYGGLIVSLGLFSLLFLKKLVKLAGFPEGMDSADVIIAMLSMIDMTLIATLVVLVLISGYDSFVAKFASLSNIEPLKDLTQVSSGAIKLKIATSIIVISTIYILEMALDFHKFEAGEILWVLIMHGTLVVTGVFLALIERLSHH
jgi:uncharacterized protein (TIGR00645 family)